MTTTTPETPETAGTTRTPATSTTRRQYPIGWLRAVAALSVVTFHAYQHHRYGDTWLWPFDGLAHRLMLGTDLFVDMFFVLSGLVLWLPIASAIGRGETSRPGRVLLYRRMARLLPLYLVVVLLVWSLTNPTAPGHWVDLVSHLTFTHVYFDDYIFWTNGPAWSLAVEFHFYVLMALSVPVLNALARRTSTRAGRMAVVWSLPVLCVVAGLTYLWWATQHSGAEETDWSVWFNPLAKATDFGLGMGLAILATSGVALRAPARALLAVGGVAALVALVLTRPYDTTMTAWWHPMFSLAIVAALSSVVLHDGAHPAWMSWRPLAWLGGLGYGIYLIHEPVLRFLGSLGLLGTPGPGLGFVGTALVVAVPTVLLAWVSSRTVEAAGLRLLATMQRDGTPRDYYDHLDADDPARVAPAPVSVGGPR